MLGKNIAYAMAKLRYMPTSNETFENLSNAQRFELVRVINTVLEMIKNAR